MDYIVGTLKAQGISSSLIFQDANISLEFDTAEVKDENGNVVYVQHYNHRAVINANAVAAKDAAQPSVGSTISVPGVTLPTFDATGKATNPSINLTTSGDAAAVDFLVTSASLATSNSEVPKYSLTLTRYLENAIGQIKTASE